MSGTIAWLPVLAQSESVSEALDPGLSVALGATGAIIAAVILGLFQYRAAKKDREAEAEEAKRDRRLTIDHYRVTERTTAFAEYIGLFVIAASRILKEEVHPPDFRDHMTTVGYRAGLLAEKARGPIGEAQDAIIAAVGAVDRGAIEKDPRMKPLVEALMKMQAAMLEDLHLEP